MAMDARRTHTRADPLPGIEPAAVMHVAVVVIVVFVLVLAVFRGAVDYSKPLAAAFGGGGQYQSLVGMASSAGCSM